MTGGKSPRVTTALYSAKAVLSGRAGAVIKQIETNFIG